MKNLEQYFDQFRKNIIGVNQTFISPYGGQNLIYADWTASGRLYRPIEEKISVVWSWLVAPRSNTVNY